MSAAFLVLLLLLIFVVSGIVARFVRLPLPIIQILLGAVIGLPTQGLHFQLDPELFLLVFVPPLLFADAYNAPKREFSELWGPILGLALGLVLLTVFVTGIALNWLIPALPLTVALALGGVLSPTDAVAVSSIIDRERVPPRLMNIIEGEALFNDASGLVAFRFAVAATLTGAFTPVRTAVAFCLVVAGGILAGYLTVLFATQTAKLSNRSGVAAVRPEVQTVVSLLLPYAAYLLAEAVHASGILAAVTAGLLIGPLGLFRYTSVSARLQISGIWQTVSGALNGAIFILLGLELPKILREVPPEFGGHFPAMRAAFSVIALTFGLMVLRFVWFCVAIGARRLAARLRGRHDPGETLQSIFVGTVAGIRGAITLAGVVSLPLVLADGSPFPARDLAVYLAAGVILCSLIAAAVILPFATRGLRLSDHDEAAEEERQARITAARAAIASIEGEVAKVEAAERDLAHAVAERLIDNYRRRIASTGSASDPELGHPDAQLESALEARLMQAAVVSERMTLRGLLRQQKINDETMHKLLDEVILAEALIVRGR